jgi:small-conductance mechanosensitive channel
MGGIVNYQIIISILIVAGTAAALFLLRRVLFRLLHRLSKKTDSKIDDLLIEGIEGPSAILAIAFVLYLGIRLSELPETSMAYAARGMSLSLIFTVTLGLANISGLLLAAFLKKVELPISVTGLLNTVAKAIVYAIGILMMLNHLGVSITPIITALGVGGLAMALALQDTLSNLFAGIHILAEHTIRVSDFIRLENGQEGVVVDIGWRTTRIRMQQNNMVIVPNSKLSQSVVTNYYLPERRMAIMMPVSVSYDADPDTVERVLIDEANKATGEVAGLLAEPAPVARFVPGFGASSLDFTLICHVSDALDQQPVQHELYKRIFKRFKREGLEIPYPTRTVYVRETASKKSGQ